MSKTWKIIIAVIIAAIVVGGGVYFWPLKKTTQVLPNTYKDTTYGFSLVFPGSWGTLESGEEVTTSSLFKIVRITAQNDPARYIQINIVKMEDKNNSAVKDYPQTYLTSNATYSYYYSGGGDSAGKPGEEDQKYFDIGKEVKAISETFKLLAASRTTVSENTSSYDNKALGISFDYPSDWKLDENKTSKSITVDSPSTPGTKGVLYIPGIRVYIPAESYDEYENTNKGLVNIQKISIPTINKEYQAREYQQESGLYYLIQVGEHFVGVKSEQYWNKKQEEGVGIILDTISF